MSRSLLSVLFAALTFSTAALATSQADYDAIAERIKPVGGVYLAGSEPVSAEPSGPRDGAKVYGTFCIACHASGVSGAPIKGNADQWAPRIAQGIDVLKTHAINGFNMMPPKGTCMDCSDDEIVAAIEHMIEGL
ncbi:cytochrome c5 family protein [Vibrio sp. Y2-5]|uniref:c-type cytochrome n=1 Tax=Vibrio TaxID=662 RepID=UPI00142D7348|nr:MULTISPECIES: cytochrome c5 family protein [Vibrio]MBD0788712.1 cytochrome c5 family protein [Vibrio sp. Y2-5]NIY94164.1 cytochrome c5 family protein [Vibrio diazotrophicus]